MSSVTFSSSIANLLFTLDVVGIDLGCSVVNTLEKSSARIFAFSPSSVVVCDFRFVWSIFSSPIPCLTVIFDL